MRATWWFDDWHKRGGLRFREGYHLFLATSLAVLSFAVSSRAWDSPHTCVAIEEVVSADFSDASNAERFFFVKIADSNPYYFAPVGTTYSWVNGYMTSLDLTIRILDDEGGEITDNFNVELLPDAFVLSPINYAHHEAGLSDLALPDNSFEQPDAPYGTAFIYRYVIVRLSYAGDSIPLGRYSIVAEYSSEHQLPSIASSEFHVTSPVPASVTSEEAMDKVSTEIGGYTSYPFHVYSVCCDNVLYWAVNVFRDDAEIELWGTAIVNGVTGGFVTADNTQQETINDILLVVVTNDDFTDFGADLLLENVRGKWLDAAEGEPNSFKADYEIWESLGDDYMQALFMNAMYNGLRYTAGAVLQLIGAGGTISAAIVKNFILPAAEATGFVETNPIDVIFSALMESPDKANESYLASQIALQQWQLALHIEYLLRSYIALPGKSAAVTKEILTCMDVINQLEIQRLQSSMRYMAYLREDNKDNPAYQVSDLTFSHLANAIDRIKALGLTPTVDYYRNKALERVLLPRGPEGEIRDISTPKPTYEQGEIVDVSVDIADLSEVDKHFLVALNIDDLNGNTIYDSHPVGEDIDLWVPAGQTSVFGPFWYVLPLDAPTGTYHLLAGLKDYPWREIAYRGLWWCNPEETFEVTTDDDISGPQYGNLSSSPDSPVYETHPGSIRIQASVTDVSGVDEVCFTRSYRDGGVVNIGYATGSDVDTYGNGTYWYDIPPTEWSLFIGETLSWQLKAWDGDCDRPDDRAMSLSEWSQIELLHETIPGWLYVDHDAPNDPGTGTASDPFRNIKDATHVADDGQTIVVRDGTYIGSMNRNIDFWGKAIILRSENGPENCIIDCQGLARGFFLISGEGRDSVIDGFTIMNGYGPTGGGILCSLTSPTIRNCKVVGCVASPGYGEFGYGGEGGGIQGCLGPITNCVITGNAALQGICWGPDPDDVSPCGGYGGGLYGCRGEIINCTIANNSAIWRSGGLGWCSGPIGNCIIWGNTAEDGAPQMEYCSQPAYSCIQDSTGSGLGNIDADPCFADPAIGDYHLKSQAGRWNSDSGSWVLDDVTSPCIDAGNPGSPLGDEPISPDNVRINMGAYGGTAEASKSPKKWGILADLTNDRVVNFSDFSAQAEGWQASGSEQPGDLDRDGKIDFNDVKILAEQWLVGYCVEVPLPNGGFEMGDLTHWANESVGTAWIGVDSFGLTEGNYHASLSAFNQCDEVMCDVGTAILSRSIDSAPTRESTISFDYRGDYDGNGYVEVGGHRYALSCDTGIHHFSTSVSGDIFLVVSVDARSPLGSSQLEIDNVRIECGR